MRVKLIIWGIIFGILLSVFYAVMMLLPLEEHQTLRSVFYEQVYVHQQEHTPDVRGYQFEDSAMEPTLEDEDFVWCDINKEAIESLAFEDLVAVVLPTREVVGNRPFFEYDEINVIKRIIGLAGDKIRIDSEGVWRNGELLDEKYIYDQQWLKPVDPELNALNEPFIDIVVPDNHVFVLGDNRDESIDSRRLEDMTLDLDESFYCKVVTIVEEK